MLICLTASHKTADFALLERLSVGTDEVARSITAHTECVNGAVVVATCNRFEAYIDIDDPVTAAGAVALEATIQAVSSATGLPLDALHNAFEMHTARSAAEHLFSVAAGLESVVVGEGEIAGQVRRALTEARERGTTSSDLERLFQRASQTSRGIKNKTAIGTAGRSLVRLGLELAESRITDWAQVRVLLVGTGAYAGASLAALRDRGANNVRVYSPSGRAGRFATSHDIAAVPAGGLVAALAETELVVTCTTVEGFVIDAGLLHAADAHRRATVAAVPSITPGACPVAPESRRLVIDLGLPRNVNPDVREAPSTELLDLETIRIHAPLEELQAADEARKLVERAATKFSAVSEEQSLTPAIIALRSHVFDLLDAEIERTRGRDTTGDIERALRHLVGTLLHTPTTRARELVRAGEQERYLDGLEALFGIVPDEAPAVLPVRRDDAARA